MRGKEKEEKLLTASLYIIFQLGLSVTVPVAGASKARKLPVVPAVYPETKHTSSTTSFWFAAYGTWTERAKSKQRIFKPCSGRAGS
jgi:hypothetical protein